MTIVLLKLLSSEHTSWASGLSRPDAIETKIAPLQNMVILRLIPIPIIPFPILKFPSENNGNAARVFPRSARANAAS